jgi:HD-GYP domain-containing protein (c-di-GMP phosphodiesterase class II)
VDAFEAMTSNRPYREAQGEEFAIGELLRDMNTQFDANVVDALIRVIGNRPTSEVRLDHAVALV